MQKNIFCFLRRMINDEVKWAHPLEGRTLSCLAAPCVMVLKTKGLVQVRAGRAAPKVWGIKRTFSICISSSFMAFSKLSSCNL